MAGQPSSPESHLANKTKMFLRAKKKRKKKSLAFNGKANSLEHKMSYYTDAFFQKYDVHPSNTIQDIKQNHGTKLSHCELHFFWVKGPITLAHYHKV